ncbi:unnamed protein product [Pleuronectes platessa]|uniref:Uncharacterized protein n=1 Tax=Pleuronectes platessa TaxID=8262 RepID=A0A9N7YX28_PLEPL|nr:unnamed protein product [Pleuronectes platessa]
MMSSLRGACALRKNQFLGSICSNSPACLRASSQILTLTSAVERVLSPREDYTHVCLLFIYTETDSRCAEDFIAAVGQLCCGYVTE